MAKIISHILGKQVPADGIFYWPSLLFPSQYQHVPLLFLSQELPAFEGQVKFYKMAST
jgi:hypothetical protein